MFVDFVFSEHGKSLEKHGRGDRFYMSEKKNGEIAPGDVFGPNKHLFWKSFWSHFPLKMHQQVDPKIDAEKVMTNHEKS